MTYNPNNHCWIYEILVFIIVLPLAIIFLIPTLPFLIWGACRQNCMWGHEWECTNKRAFKCYEFDGLISEDLKGIPITIDTFSEKRCKICGITEYLQSIEGTKNGARTIWNKNKPKY